MLWIVYVISTLFWSIGLVYSSSSGGLVRALVIAALIVTVMRSIQSVRRNINSR